MESTEHLARVIKEAKAQFERECANLPRPEIDRLGQRQLLELVFSTTGAVIKKDRINRSEPGTFTSNPWKTWSPLVAPSKVTDEASMEPLSLHMGSLPIAEGPPIPKTPQTTPPPSHASQQIPEEGLVEGSGKRKRKRSLDTLSTYELLPPPYALRDVAPDAPKLRLYALNIGCLEVRRLSNSAENYRVLATGDLRHDLPQSHRRGVSDFQAAILLGEELALQDFGDLIEVCNTEDTDTLQLKLRTICSLCMSVGALLYNGDSFNESQTRIASRSAAEAFRVFSDLKVDVRRDEDEDKVPTPQEEVDFYTAVSELDAIIADLATCSFDLQMVNIM